MIQSEMTIEGLPLREFIRDALIDKGLLPPMKTEFWDKNSLTMTFGIRDKEYFLTIRRKENPTPEPEKESYKPGDFIDPKDKI